MNKQCILFLLLLLPIALFAQNRVAKGYVLDKDSRAALKDVEVWVEGEKEKAITNERGEFAIDVKKGRNCLIIKKENYDSFRYKLQPGFQHRANRIYLESNTAVNSYSKKRLENDSLFLTFKNAVSLSIIEFFAVGIGMRYERFFLQKHACGLHITYYFNGRSASYYTDASGYDSRSSYTGFKMAPFYRIYTNTQKTMRVFIEGKIPFGYFDFDRITYRYRTTTHLTTSISPNFWTWGFGGSIGFMARLPKTKHGLVNFSIGGQYFPMADVPKSIPREVSMGAVIQMEGNADWWYWLGPGGYIEVKLTFGGIF